MSRSRTDDMTDADARVLEYLEESGADYPALIASNTGLHIPLVERRCDALEDRGLLEPVTDETVYRITDRGSDWVVPGPDRASD